VSLAERRGLRLFTLSVLFLAQGIPWGFMAITLPSYVTERLPAHGFDDTAVAAVVGSLVAYSTLPYTYKFIWGPLMDSVTIPRFGRRRPWIILAQTLMALTIAALLFIDPLANTGALLALVLVHTTCNAMQNVAVDALAIELLAPEERGRANGIMYGMKYLGGAIGGLGLATVIEYEGLQVAIAVQAAILLAITAVPLLVKERAGAPPPKPPVAEVMKLLGRLGRLRSIRRTALLMFVQYVGGGMLSAIAFGLFLNHLGWDDVGYTQFAGGPALVFGAAGSMCGGFLADKVGRKQLAATASASLATVWIAFSLGHSWWQHDPIQYALLVVEPMLQGAMTASLFTLCMDTSLPRTAATQYVAYTSLMNLGTTLGAKVLGHRALSHWDYNGVYLAAGLAQLAGLALLPFIATGEAREQLDHSAPTASVSSKPTE